MFKIVTNLLVEHFHNIKSKVIPAKFQGFMPAILPE